MKNYEDIIKGDQIERLQNIALSFKESDEELIKGITEDEFNSKYPKDEYEVYTEASLSKFSSELRKAEQTGTLTEDVIEKAKKDISKLQKKTLIGKDGKKHTVYVKIGSSDTKIEHKKGNDSDYEVTGGKIKFKEPSYNYLEGKKSKKEDEKFTEAEKRYLKG